MSGRGLGVFETFANRDGHDLAALARRISELEDRLRMVPSDWPTIPEFLSLVIAGGNTLITSPFVEYGIKNTYSTITTLPAVAPVNGQTYPDGLGYGQVAGGTTLVWIANAALQPGGTGTVVSGGLASYIPRYTPIWCQAIVTFDVGGVAVPVYQIYKPAA